MTIGVYPSSSWALQSVNVTSRPISLTFDSQTQQNYLEISNDFMKKILKAIACF
ncbi:hypothetical protein [Halotia branconii]|uniref:Uncharacterized protein n=1 Tax=Halotia branconii CENA392 TaxID=1539056 RepID=A0AAJ6P759_9CYAN|nr:hypothetical protein [Halotia branconii]WGV23295.1 hypothetical protein QI031_15830 [Halotia branconii CENA392]